MHKVEQKLQTVKMNLMTICVEDRGLDVRRSDNTFSNSVYYYNFV